MPDGPVPLGKKWAVALGEKLLKMSTENSSAKGRQIRVPKRNDETYRRDKQIYMKTFKIKNIKRLKRNCYSVLFTVVYTFQCFNATFLLALKLMQPYGLFVISVCPLMNGINT